MKSSVKLGLVGLFAGGTWSLLTATCLHLNRSDGIPMLSCWPFLLPSIPFLYLAGTLFGPDSIAGSSPLLQKATFGFGAYLLVPLVLSLLGYGVGRRLDARRSRERPPEPGSPRPTS